MINSTKPAFAAVSIGDRNEYLQDGLSKREYFAGLAMQGLMTTLIPLTNNQSVPNFDNVKYCAELAVTAADELLKQLEKKPINN